MLGEVSLQQHWLMGEPAQATSRHFYKYVFSILGCQLCCSILVEPWSKMLGVDLLADQ